MTTENRTLKIPAVLYRAGSFEVTKDDPDNIRLSVSSDIPYKRYDYESRQEYYEKLDHSATGVDLTRIQTGTALLYNHDTGIHLGKITKPELASGKLFVDAKLTKAADVASHRTRIDEGILTDSSVAYEVLDQGIEDGEIDGIPVYRFKWAPYEASLCPVAADITTGIGRGKVEYRNVRIVEKNISEDSQKRLDAEREESQKRETQPTIMDETPEAKAAREEKERKQRERDMADAARENDEKIQEGVRVARERETEIRDIAKRGNVPEAKKAEFEREMQTAIEKSVKSKEAVGDFQTYVFKNFWGKAEPVETPAGEGAADIKVVGQRNQPGGGERRLTAGERFVNTKGFAEFAKGNTKGDFRAAVGGSILAERGLMQRAGFNSSDLAAVNVTISQEMISLGVQRLTIMDLLAGGVMTTAGFIYPVENSFDPFATAATTVAERGLKPEWEPDVTTARADAQVIAVMATVPKQFMADFGAFGSWLNSRGDYLLQIKAEQQILYGDGLGSNLLGITARTGIQTRAYGTVGSETTPDALFRGNTDIETNAYFDPDGFAMHPYDFEQIRLLKDANGQYFGGGPFYAPYGNGTFLKYHTIWGLPCVVSKSVKQGKPIAGAWKMGAQWFLREGLQIETSTSHKDYFQRNLLAVLFEERMALAVYRPIAFLEHTGFPGRS